MIGKDTRIGALLTALSLSALTLLVFWTLQDAGPQSVVRRFNEAVLANDNEAIAKLVIQPVDDPSVVQLKSSVLAALQNNARIQFRREQPVPVTTNQGVMHGVFLVVVYLHPDQSAEASGWFVLHVGRRTWKIDAAAMQRQLEGTG